jgi:hypothetical protein
MNEEDVIQLNSALFLRLLELSREDVKDDADLHFITEKVTAISQERVATMDDYEEIIANMKGNRSSKELEDIKRLGGL